MSKTLSPLLVVAFSLAALFLPVSASAALLLYEGFNYPGLSDNDDLDGQSGGTWTAGSSWDGGGLIYQSTGLTHANVSGSGGLGIVQTTFQADRTWNVSTIPGTSSNESYWGYFLFNANGNNMSSGDRVRFWSDGSSSDGLGVEFNGTTLNAFVEAGGADDSGNSVDFVNGDNSQLSTTQMVLFHVQFGDDGDDLTDTAADNDSIYVWLNPGGLTSAPALGTADSVATAIAADDKGGLYLRDNDSVGSDPAETFYSFDEFKLGDDYADLSVIPEPSATALLMAFLGLFLMLRRQRS